MAGAQPAVGEAGRFVDFESNAVAEAVEKAGAPAIANLRGKPFAGEERADFVLEAWPVAAGA